jgi:outer membrane protein assembly factor BamB
MMKMNASATIVLTAALVGSQVFADDWLQWRGPNRTDVSGETGLLNEWPAGGPKQIWMNKNCGLGYAGFAVKGTDLVTMGLDGSNEFLLCLDANTGKEKWRTNFAGKFANPWGDGPRSTPTINGENVYALAASGQLVCCSLTNGQKIWEASLTKLGGKTPYWGYSESPLVDEGNVICTPGGDNGAIVALDKETGKVKWQSKEVTDAAHYSSIIKIELGDMQEVKQYVQLFPERVVGVDPENGEVIWSSKWHGSTAVIPTPIYGDGMVYICSGYGAGCKLIEVSKDGSATDKYQNRVMKNHHGGAILVDGHVYGYSDGVGWVCQNFETGEMVWSDKSLGKGAITYADGNLYALEEDTGTVALIEATTEGFNEISRFELQPQSEQRSPQGKIWVHPVIANGKLYLRDQEIIYCYDIKG